MRSDLSQSVRLLGPLHEPLLLRTCEDGNTFVVLQRRLLVDVALTNKLS